MLVTHTPPTQIEKTRDIDKALIVEYPPCSDTYENSIFIGNLSYTSRPAAVIVAETNCDVKDALLLAKKKQVPFTVRGGGHGYAGNCLNKDGIMVDLSKMNEVLLDRATMTAKVQGGAKWVDVYDKFRGDDVDLMIVGGQCPTVGVGGYTLGGGLSPFSRSYGLANDNVLALTVVTAKGKILYLTNSEEDSSRKNLFWALLGGGGGNFGIVTEFTFRVNKLRGKKCVIGQLTWPVCERDGAEAFTLAMNKFNSMKIPDELCMDAFWSFKDGDDTKSQAQMTIIYNGTMDECTQLLSPVLDFGPENGLKEMFWYEWENLEKTFFKFEKVYERHMSIILEEGAITQEVTETILDLMKKAPRLSPGASPGTSPVNKCRIVWDHIGGATSRVSRKATPFPWRNGTYVLDAMAQWGSEDQSEEALAWVNECRRRLAPFSIDKRAAYLNYIDAGLKDWRYAYYAENYERLREIKSEWDPDNVFNYSQSIELAPADAPTLARVVDGSKDTWDELKEEGIAFDRYEDIVQATKKDLSIAKTIFAVGVTSGYHSLSVLEMQLILSGSGIVELDGEKTPFKSGDRIIVPAGVKQRHVNAGTVPIEMLCVCTPAFFIKDYTEFEKPLIDTAFAEKAKGIVATIPYFGLQQQHNETLKGKTAVVTGAAGEGMGKELCRQLGRMGCRVMLTGRDPSKTCAAVQELKAEGLDILGTPVDVTSDKDISNLVSACENQFSGKVDILINNAGVNFDEAEMSDLDKATRTMDVNFYGPIRMTDAFTKSSLMQTNGRVINISTELAESYYIDNGPPLPYPMFPIYKSSKQALNNWSREKAVDLEEKGISLNVVNPGWVQTPMGGGSAPDTLLDGVQATLYLSTTDNSHHGGFFERYTKEKVPAGMVKISTISW